MIRLILFIFSFLLFGTSIIKNKTREIEKKINNYNEVIYDKEKDHKESQLDYYYLTSPSIIEKKVDNLINDEYFPMEYSKIFLVGTSIVVNLHLACLR